MPRGLVVDEFSAGQFVRRTDNRILAEQKLAKAAELKAALADYVTRQVAASAALDLLPVKNLLRANLTAGETTARDAIYNTAAAAYAAYRTQVQNATTNDQVDAIAWVDP